VDRSEEPLSTVVRQVMPVFTPSAVSGEHLENITVGRTLQLQAIHDAFRAAATSKNRPNILLVGPRGSGKSHLISVALYRLEAQQKTRKKLLVVWLPEDVYTVTSYRDLVRTMIITAGGQVDNFASDSELEAGLLQLAAGRVIVLVAENFDRTLRLLGEPGQRSLRAFQHNSGSLMMLASMPAIDEKLLDHSAPFYGQFRVLHLEDLDVEQGRELLIKTALRNDDADLVEFLESPTGLARVRTIAQLAGGSPRIWLLISGLMTVELLDELVALFTKLLDELTPYFKARMDELAPAKAKILATICMEQSSAMSVREIAEQTGMTQQTASKQLGELERDRFIRKTKNDADKRVTYYELREPLLRYVLELKSNHGETLSLIVSFLAAWYSATELINQYFEKPNETRGCAARTKLLAASPTELMAEIVTSRDSAALTIALLVRSVDDVDGLQQAVNADPRFDLIDQNQKFRISILIVSCADVRFTHAVANFLRELLSQRSPEWRFIFEKTEDFSTGPTDREATANQEKITLKVSKVIDWLVPQLPGRVVAQTLGDVSGGAYDEAYEAVE
jgi:DNA-binding MarR family transcriptional regulator